jgi:hypothetical protein
MVCENCGKDHDGSYGSGRFCNQKCAKGFSTLKDRKEINKKKSITMGGTGNLKEKLSNCLYCGEKLGWDNKKFCNGVHSSKYYQEKKWKEIDSNGNCCNMTNKSIRLYLIDRKGYKCELCGISKWKDEPVPLVLDHIDGNSDNNNLINFRLICRNCDGLLPTFSGRNIGKGRHTLRMIKKKKREENGLSR